MAYAETRMSLAYVTKKVIGSPTFSMAGSKHLKNAGKDLPLHLLGLLSFCVAFMQAVFTYGGRMVTGSSTFTFCCVATMKEDQDCFPVTPMNVWRVVFTSQAWFISLLLGSGGHSFPIGQFWNQGGRSAFSKIHGPNREALQMKAGCCFQKIVSLAGGNNLLSQPSWNS